MIGTEIGLEILGYDFSFPNFSRSLKLTKHLFIYLFSHYTLFMYLVIHHFCTSYFLVTFLHFVYNKYGKQAGTTSGLFTG